MPARGTSRNPDRQRPPPCCACGCGEEVMWFTKKARWRRYCTGHYRRPADYKSSDWLRRRYIEERATTDELAAECEVSGTTILKFMRKFGIESRDRAEARRGRHLGSANGSWKGGVSEWPYSVDWQEIAIQIRNRDKWTCQDCGERRTRWGKALHVHHIDGDKLNDAETNLVSLCALCHRQRHLEGTPS